MTRIREEEDCCNRLYKRFHYLCLKNTAYTVYKVNYCNGRTSNISSYFYGIISVIFDQTVLYNAECDLLVIALLVVWHMLCTVISSLFHIL